MLFSEPKIPQCRDPAPPEPATCTFQCSSASRKFLNQRFRHNRQRLVVNVSVLFSEPKIPQSRSLRSRRVRSRCFSALQRAENSSIGLRKMRSDQQFVFQCSSASRKFLNTAQSVAHTAARMVSVLFSEPKIPQCTARPARTRSAGVSVLFSEPKIPQSPIPPRRNLRCEVSVLFSEPKIPQFGYPHRLRAYAICFSALQRAENSSILHR